MKTTAKIIAIIFLLGAGMWLTPQRAQAHYGITYQVFYDDLSPYGTWIYAPDYGYVWVPDAGPDFMPYSTAGNWTYSVYGWTWVSYYPWGWAPFHYGRWYFDNWYGWVWVPGTEWGPGWVAWSQCDGYYGWAPLTPHINITINFNLNLIPPHAWVFVPRMHFGLPGMDRYYVDRMHNDRYLHRSLFIAGTGTDRETNVRYYAGPSAREVAKVTGREIRPVEVRRNEQPGQSVRDDRNSVYDRSKTTPALKQERYTPQQQRVTPKQETVAPKQERVTPKPEQVAPKQERVTPSQDKKPQPNYKGNVNTNRQPAPPVRQKPQDSRGAKPEARQTGPSHTQPRN
jgi:hypothetical protein